MFNPIQTGLNTTNISYNYDTIHMHNYHLKDLAMNKETASTTDVNNTAARQIGLSKNDFIIPNDFDAPLPEDIIDSFYQTDSEIASLRSQ